MLSANQVAHQYSCSKSIDVLCFLHGHNHQAKVQPENTSFAWVCSVRLRDSLIIKISRKDYVICHQGKILSKTSTFGWLWPVLSLCPIRFQDSLIINITRKKIFCIAIVIKKRSGVLLVQSYFRNFWLSISQEGIKWYLRFFTWKYSSRERSIWDYHSWLNRVRCASFPIRLQDSWLTISLEKIN